MQEDDEDLRNSRNEYPGYVVGPKKPLEQKNRLRLDFNPKIFGRSLNEGGSTLEGFSLRIFEHPEDRPLGTKGFEMAVRLTVEQWTDLIDAMKAELSMARRVSAEMDDNQREIEE